MKTIQITDRKEMEAFILQQTHCMVGLVDTEGNPYVIPMNFTYTDGCIYLHSGPAGGKLEMLKRNSRVCITFCEDGKLVWMHPQMACSYSMKARSVMCRGNVRLIDEMDEKRRILTLLMKHYTDYPCGFSDPAVRNVCVWEVKVDEMTGKSFGLRPDEI